MSNWVDFKKLRETLDFVQVLEHYQVPFKRKGTQAVGACPLPGHQGDKKSQSFSVSLAKRIFQCFGCGAKGNVLDFITRMENLDPHNPAEFRKAALIAQQTFAISPHENARQATPTTRKVPPTSAPQQPPVHGNAQPTLVNEPLDFALKNLDDKPQYLLHRGFNASTIAHFGLGFCTKGLFAGRVVIPLHDLQGRLIGYAGRLIYDDAIDAENPKYLFPSRRERNGKIYEFGKSLFVYNGHHLAAPVDDLYVVQGFPAAWWLWQHGHENVVALMGATCSVDQSSAIIKITKQSTRVWCFTDADKTGEKCAHSLLHEVGTYRFCKWVRPQDGQPTDCSAEQLDELLAWEVEV